MIKFIVCSILCMSVLRAGFAQNGMYADYAQYREPIDYSTDVKLKGRRILFDSSWARAKVLSANNTLIQNDSFYFNFDKISQNLYVTKDYKKVYEVDKREYKAVLFYWNDTKYLFKHVYLINKKDFFQEIIQNDDKYSLYKLIHATVRVRSNTALPVPDTYRRFELFKDVPEYFILFPNKEYKSLFLIKKSSLDRAFKLSPDNQKVNEFMQNLKEDIPEEEILRNLITYLNQ